MSRSNGGRRARRRFSAEFKEGAVRLVLDEGKTVGAMGLSRSQGAEVQ